MACCNDNYLLFLLSPSTGSDMRIYQRELIQNCHTAGNRLDFSSLYMAEQDMTSVASEIEAVSTVIDTRWFSHFCHRNIFIQQKQAIKWSLDFTKQPISKQCWHRDTWPIDDLDRCPIASFAVDGNRGHLLKGEKRPLKFIQVRM